MVVLMGSSSFLQSPISRSLCSPSSSSQLGSSPLLCAHRKAAKKRKKLMAMASIHGDKSMDGSDSLQRRAVLLLGISVLPLLRLRAVALDGRGMIRGGARTLSEARHTRGDLENKEDAGKLEAEVPKQSEQAISSQLDQSEQVFPQNVSGNSEKLEAAVTKQPEKENLPQEPKQTKLVNVEDAPGIPNSAEAKALQQAKPEILSQEASQTEQILQQGTPGNPFVSFLNELGIIGSGLLGALYATSQKEKSAMGSTIESMKTTVAKKEAALTSLKEGFEKRLLNEQTEHKNQVKRLKEEEATLLNQLASTNLRTANLSQELANEKNLVKELIAEKDQLHSLIAKAGEDKKVLEAKLKEKMGTVDGLNDKVSLLSLEINDKEKSIRDLTASLAKKGSECQNLNSMLDQTKGDLAEARSIIEQLKEEISIVKKELNVKTAVVDDLNGAIKSLSAERDETTRKLHGLMNEYNDFKSSSEKRLGLNSELLSKKDDELHQLEEKLTLAFREIQDNQATITKLTAEKNDLRATLEKEANGVKILNDELQNTRKVLDASINDASNLSKELEEAKRSYNDLNSVISRMQHDFSESKESLTSELKETNRALRSLSKDLASVEESLKTTKEEFDAASNELKSVKEERASLKKELLEIYKKAEVTVQELKEERNAVSALNRELEALNKQLRKDSESRRALQSDLDEATRSLDEMNKSALLLSKELEATNTRTAGLETDKDILIKSLKEQKEITQEAKENLEDAQNLIMRLGNEREIFEKRSRLLENDLAAAKGEIMRLKRQMGVKKESVNQQSQITNEVSVSKSPNEIPAGTPFTVKRTGGRRRKAGPPSQAEQ